MMVRIITSTPQIKSSLIFYVSASSPNSNGTLQGMPILLPKKKVYVFFSTVGNWSCFTYISHLNIVFLWTCLPVTLLINALSPLISIWTYCSWFIIFSKRCPYVFLIGQMVYTWVGAWSHPKPPSQEFLCLQSMKSLVDSTPINLNF